ncbi:helix-turn-helix domain-containing protein [Rhodococcus sp. NPDC057014]|uniref:helix-turn-helix domain-containing protein n=1 Tax=Rhodococcus sp. NPDC057014 TaxID=3346000 RepID=UPI00363E37D6
MNPQTELSPLIETTDMTRWADAIWNLYGGLRVETERENPLWGRLTRRDFEQLRAVDLQLTQQAMHRTAPMIASHPTNEIFVGLVVEGSSLTVQDGRTAVANPGEFTLVDSTRPYSSILTQPARVIDFSWTRGDFGLSESESLDLTARTIGGNTSPLGRVLTPMLMELFQMDDGLSPAGAMRLQSTIADLIVTAALELSLPCVADSRSRRQYDEMVRYIDRNLEDPELSADSIAAEFFVSTRTVHRLFARFENSAAAVIRDRRLEACRQMMLSPAHRGKSISYLISQFGFSSLRVFSRMFTAKYGSSPKRYRETHSSSR